MVREPFLKFTDLNLSSATIRNEMADLEELGFIIQPHTSAGRIPSDKGYRFYVDNLMKEKIAEVDDMKEMMIEKADKVDQLLKRVAKLASKYQLCVIDFLHRSISAISSDLFSCRWLSRHRFWLCLC